MLCSFKHKNDRLQAIISLKLNAKLFYHKLNFCLLISSLFLPSFPTSEPFFKVYQCCWSFSFANKCLPTHPSLTDNEVTHIIFEKKIMKRRKICIRNFKIHESKNIMTKLYRVNHGIKFTHTTKFKLFRPKGNVIRSYNVYRTGLKNISKHVW